jgi:cellobiose-specific phosphotransferase system component IIC
MSACGFSWCYLLVLVAVARGLDWLDDDHVLLALRIGYILIIPAVLSSGLMIMLDSWARAYRTQTIGSIGTAAWNTYAQIHNTYHAIKDLDKAFAGVMDMFEGGSGSSDKKKGGAALVLVFVIVILALVSGVLTTGVIIKRVAGNDELPGDAAPT